MKKEIIEILTKHLFEHSTENWSGEIIQDHQFERIAKNIIDSFKNKLPNDKQISYHIDKTYPSQGNIVHHNWFLQGAIWMRKKIEE